MSDLHSPVLRLDDVGVHFDGVVAVDGVSLSLRPGEVLGLIGPNGSGKTTTLNIISGFVKPSRGRVVFNGVDISRIGISARARMGLVRTFQSVRPFGRLTVEENIMAAALGARCSMSSARGRAQQLMHDLGLDEFAHRPAGDVPAGAVRKLGIARALSMRPTYVLLDEPAAGQNEAEAVELIKVIRNIALERDAGVLLVEHDMQVVMETCDRLHVLAEGRTLVEGLPSAVRKDPRVIETYFGKSA